VSAQKRAGIWALYKNHLLGGGITGVFPFNPSLVESTERAYLGQI